MLYVTILMRFAAALGTAVWCLAGWNAFLRERMWRLPAYLEWLATAEIGRDLSHTADTAAVAGHLVLKEACLIKTVLSLEVKIM